jgi:hypothetical protein
MTRRPCLARHEDTALYCAAHRGHTTDHWYIPVAEHILPRYPGPFPMRWTGIGQIIAASTAAEAVLWITHGVAVAAWLPVWFACILAVMWREVRAWHRDPRTRLAAEARQGQRRP